MILTLRTDSPIAEIGLYSQDGVRLAYEQWEAHRRLAETIHTKMKTLLDGQGSDWADLTGVVVYKGPGSFTGLRIGISVANALSYSLNIPVVGVGDEGWISEGIEQVTRRGNTHPVIPFYGSDANITTPKK
jgi:tRNA threonylcarbamoyladenosine biosynthesis protein TsaB